MSRKQPPDDQAAELQSLDVFGPGAVRSTAGVWTGLLGNP